MRHITGNLLRKLPKERNLTFLYSQADTYMLIVFIKGKKNFSYHYEKQEVTPRSQVVAQTPTETVTTSLILTFIGDSSEASKEGILGIQNWQVAYLAFIKIYIHMKKTGEAFIISSFLKKMVN